MSNVEERVFELRITYNLPENEFPERPRKLILPSNSIELMEPNFHLLFIPCLGRKFCPHIIIMFYA